MQTNVSKVKIGDYVHDLGIVSNVKHFYRREAVRGRTVQNVKRGFDRLDYARLIEEQQEGSYNEVLDKVVLYVGANSKTYDADKELNVVRFRQVA